METTPQPPQGAPARSGRSRRLRGLIALPFAALILSGCTVPSFGAKKSDTTTGLSTYHLWQGFSIAAAIIGGGTLLLILYAVLRYRRKDDSIPKQSQYHIPLELLYTILPILIVIGLFATTLVVENKVVAEPKTSYVVNINAFQWGWKFSYPGTNALVVGQTTQKPTMMMPLGVDVHFNLTSSDVVHGFYVPDFNFSRYALPGVTNNFTFHAMKTGTFFGQCTQLCGLYHSLMFFQVKVVSLPEYRNWIHQFDTPAGAAAAQAAQQALEQQNATHVPYKPASTTGTGAAN
ncbi:MAG: cytochrome c oxidase subunit II [Actinomycetota bacterium]